jgi:DNA-binding response OmpR family regulator
VSDAKRILVVEDDDTLRAVLRAVLEEAGYYVATLDRSTYVPGSVRAQEPDLITLDYLMPERSGGVVAAELRSLGCTVPILFVTGLSLTGDSLEGHALLTKPFELDDLLAQVERLIGPP